VENKSLRQRWPAIGTISSVLAWVRHTASETRPTANSFISLSMNSGSNSRLYGGFTNPRPDQSCARPSSSGPALVGIAQKWRSS